MSASNEHPGRPLFDSNWNPGLLRTLVETEHARKPVASPNLQAIRKVFILGRVPALAQLAAYIASKEGLVQIGSGSIDLDGVAKGEFTLDAARRLQELYVGDLKLGITPLAWLGYLAARFDEVPQELRRTLEAVVSEMNRINESKRAGTVLDGLDGDIPRVPFDAPFN